MAVAPDDEMVRLEREARRRSRQAWDTRRRMERVWAEIEASLRGVVRAWVPEPEDDD